jgi:hypothetical protein
MRKQGGLIAALSSVASRHVHPTVHGNPDYHALSASALPRLSEPAGPHLMTLSMVQLANRLDNVPDRPCHLTGLPSFPNELLNPLGSAMDTHCATSYTNYGSTGTPYSDIRLALASALFIGGIYTGAMTTQLQLS